ncbi:MAG TPA: hypothetical protein VJM31_06900 [Vicinamibacterales bacterium]|nr:hypothetical protein [Vicinamibacterales bacterium]
MLSRRELIAGGAVMSQLKADDAAAAQRSGAEANYSDELRSIQGALAELANKVSTPTVAAIRDRQRQFLRLNQRFPQAIAVGIRVFERMQDWHINNGRVLTIQRGADNEWQMDFLMSVLVLKLELGENEIGPAYDR